MADYYLDGGEATVKLNLTLDFSLSGWTGDGASKEEIEKDIKDKLQKDAEGSTVSLLKACTDYEVDNVSVTVNANVEKDDGGN